MVNNNILFYLMYKLWLVVLTFRTLGGILIDWSKWPYKWNIDWLIKVAILVDPLWVNRRAILVDPLLAIEVTIVIDPLMSQSMWLY